MTDIVERVTDELLAHGEFSANPNNNRPNAREAAKVVVEMVTRAASEWRDISTAPVIAQRDDRETIARILVPHWLGGFENQERVDTPDASGWRSWKNPPFTPNARAYAIADEILAALSMPISAPPQRNEVKP